MTEVTATRTIEEEIVDFYAREARHLKRSVHHWPGNPEPYETPDGEVLVIAAAAARCLREATEAIAEIKQSPINRNPERLGDLALSRLRRAEIESPHCRDEARRLAKETNRVVLERAEAWHADSRGAPAEEPEPATEAVLEAAGRETI